MQESSLHIHPVRSNLIAAMRGNKGCDGAILTAGQDTSWKSTTFTGTKTFVTSLALYLGFPSSLDFIHPPIRNVILDIGNSTKSQVSFICMWSFYFFLHSHDLAFFNKWGSPSSVNTMYYKEGSYLCKGLLHLLYLRTSGGTSIFSICLLSIIYSPIFSIFIGCSWPLDAWNDCSSLLFSK